jgi:hypothetical protein
MMKRSSTILMPVIMNMTLSASLCIVTAYVSSIKLAPSTTGLLEGVRSRTSGWGKISDSKYSLGMEIVIKIIINRCYFDLKPRYLCKSLVIELENHTKY